MSIHNEISFETEICQHLSQNGWLYAEGDAAGYDRARALFPADVLARVHATQPKAGESLSKNHVGLWESLRAKASEEAAANAA
jgi:type I restriction enzyme R subunit